MSAACLASLRLLLAAVLFLLPLEAFAAQIPKLASPPEGERWFGIYMGNDRVGFGNLVITRTGDGYRIESQGSVKMRVMAVSREATSKESYLVGPDLVLRSFSVENRLDGSPLLLNGEVTAGAIRIVSEAGGKKKERTLKTKGAVYPPHALNLYPLMQGALPGKTYKISILDVEATKVKQYKVEVVGEESFPPGIPSVHLRNNLYPMVDNDIWLDMKGNVLKESVRDDLVVTLAEDREKARAELAEAVLCRKDLVLDYSMIRITPPLEHREQLQKLSVEMTGIPSEFPLLQGKRQQATRLPDGKVVFAMPNPSFAPAAAESPTAADTEPAPRIPSDAAEIKEKAAEIAGGEKDPDKVARRLSEWVAKEIKGAVTDSQSPLETLQKRAGNCQSHARLYASLARAAGIPTRFVSGIVYQDKGFLYHSWAESYLNGGWVAIDPTFGEFPADLTHIKFVEGDSLDEMGIIAGIMGRVHARIAEKLY